MHEIALFVEDYAHQQVVGALVERLAEEYAISVRRRWHSAVRGYGRVVQELNDYLRDMERQGAPWPDLIVAATDANCHGAIERIASFGRMKAPAPVVTSSCSRPLFGIEYAAEVVQHMNIDRAMRADSSLQRCVDQLRDIFRGWAC